MGSWVFFIHTCTINFYYRVELSVGMQTEGVDIRSVGNTAVSQTIAIIILYSLKIYIASSIQTNHIMLYFADFA